MRRGPHGVLTATGTTTMAMVTNYLRHHRRGNKKNEAGVGSVSGNIGKRKGAAAQVAERNRGQTLVAKIVRTERNHLVWQLRQRKTNAARCDVASIFSACETQGGAKQAWHWANTTCRHSKLHTMFDELADRVATEFGKQYWADDAKEARKRYSAEAFVVECSAWADLVTESLPDVMTEIKKIRELHTVEQSNK